MSLLRKLFKVRSSVDVVVADDGRSSIAPAHAADLPSDRGLPVLESVHALTKAGRLCESLALIDRELAITPKDAELWLARASALFHWDRFRESLECCARAESLGLDTAALYSQMGWSRLCAGSPQTAEGAMRKAAEIEPGEGTRQHDLGVTLAALRKDREAESQFEQVLALTPDHFDSLIGLCGCALSRQDLPAAESWARRAIASDGERAAGWNHLGVVLNRQERFAEAIETFARAEQLEDVNADNPEAFANLGIDLLDAGRVEEAIAVFRRHLARTPTINGHFLYALSLLTNGEFREGWSHYDYRLLGESALMRRPNVQRPVWAGQDLEGRTILLRDEQGRGDTIQFLRYAPLLKELGATVLFHSARGFARLARGFAGLDQVIEEREAPPYDFHSRLMTLPRVFGTGLESIPADVPYLRAESTLTQCWLPRLDARGKMKVGLVWAGSPAHIKDRFRTISLRSLAPLGRQNGAQFFSLQKGPRAEEASNPPTGLDLIDLGPQLEDFADTAAVIGQLDLVIAVDTAVAHMAGAMGKPVWMLLPEPADWRWLREREDTPWYPTMRLFRQTARGEWTDVIEKVAHALSLHLSERRLAPIREPQSSKSVCKTHFVPRSDVRPNARSGMSDVMESNVGILQFLPDELVVGKSIAFYGEYLQPQVDLLERFVRSGNTIVEAGTGVGVHTLALAKAAGADGTVFAYESRPVHRRLLRQNLASNRISNVTLMKGKLGTRSGSNAVTPGGAWGAAPQEADESIASRMETVDDLRLEHLNLLKTGDGIEALDVLNGASETLWRLRPFLFCAVPDNITLLSVAERAKEFGYRRWELKTAFFRRDNFNRREGDVFDGKSALALVAIPEENDPDVLSANCIELA